MRRVGRLRRDESRRQARENDESNVYGVTHESPSEVHDASRLGSSEPNACAPPARVRRHDVNGAQSGSVQQRVVEGTTLSEAAALANVRATAASTRGEWQRQLACQPSRAGLAPAT